MNTLTKVESRRMILEAQQQLGLTHAEMARLLVGEGRGGRSTYDKWVLAPDNPNLRKASYAALRHIETLKACKAHCPEVLDQLIDNVRLRHRSAS